MDNATSQVARVSGGDKEFASVGKGPTVLGSGINLVHYVSAALSATVLSPGRSHARRHDEGRAIVGFDA
jgi:hypothetical protein